MSLTQQQLDSFTMDGVVRIDGAVPMQVARQCRDELWLATGYDPQDRPRGPTPWCGLAAS